ncbi:MAG: NADH-quinone oxidoreductase subunit J, partial [Candidatus Cybelea sp.]
PNRLPKIWLPAGVFTLSAFGFLIYAVSNVKMAAAPATGAVGNAGVFGSVADFGKALFTVQLLPFEATALVLMVAVIGVITLGGEQMSDAEAQQSRMRADRAVREAILREGKG